MTDAPRTRAHWTLERRLIVALVSLLAAVSAIVGTVSVVVVHSNLVDRVDSQLASATERGRVAIIEPPPGFEEDGDGDDGDDGRVLAARGQSVGTIAGIVVGGEVRQAAVLEEDGGIGQLDDDQLAALSEVPADFAPHSVNLGGDLGAYRAMVVGTPGGDRFVIALPLAIVEATTAQLAVVITLVAAAGLALAALIGSLLVRRALVPLQRVAATAERVSTLPLERGEVELADRVPDSDTDERTEVGRVGASFNRMLDHVGQALTARAESEAKVRRFVGDASHELRTPIASIRGYAELTRRSTEEVPPDAAHALDRIESESLRMSALVDDLLLLARLDEGRELRSDDVDLSALVVDVVGDAHVAGPDHRWELDVPEEPVLVAGDLSRLHQVLANLLANARVHTPAGTTVSVALAHDGGDAVVTVADDGPGIAPDLQRTLFERFARGDASRSRATGSTGLGLAIARAVVVAHGGSIGVESEPGRTVFTVRLRAA
ncbi:two-component sensor histidine kinase [Agromyces rhizosphaerae]|uniref:histidine kinase n=1 Tax=Agromyces rhizosphaerae TaxID=88374 RepID=A0A9W6CWP4_9MICO|nr:HAMP domain-containing sensor histidine kinase [Agromyces rhizosphaerae]GLI26709.1 two-component sensor histidine kinase [Agromyces rhizosphaerae]